MLTRKRSLKFAMFACLVLGLSFIGAQTPTIVESGWTKVYYLYSGSDALRFNTTYKNSALSSCDTNDRWILNTMHPDYATQVATLTAAFLANREVYLYIVAPSGGSTCSPTIDRFRVR